MKDDFKKFIEALNDSISEETLLKNLKLASIFIATYENFKKSMAQKVKYLYYSGFKNEKEQFAGYKENVLKNMKEVQATLEWLKKEGAFNEAECKSFDCYRETRNKFSHNLTQLLWDGFPIDALNQLEDMLDLYEKFDKWWIMEIEIPTSGEYTISEAEDLMPNEYFSFGYAYIITVREIVVRDLYNLKKNNPSAIKH